MILMDEQLATKIKNFVAQGGTFIMSAHGAVKNRDNTMTDETIPIFGLNDLFGVGIDSFNCYQPPSRERNAIKFQDGVSVPVQVFAENLQPKNARVIANWERDFLQGAAACTENRSGKGRAVYYGSFFNLEAARYLLMRYAAEQNLRPLFGGFPANNEVTRRTKGRDKY
jgi:beta-galactosidase GanA